jgi:hypothetical protein
MPFILLTYTITTCYILNKIRKSEGRRGRANTPPRLPGLLTSWLAVGHPACALLLPHARFSSLMCIARPLCALLLHRARCSSIMHVARRPTHRSAASPADGGRRHSHLLSFTRWSPFAAFSTRPLARRLPRVGCIPVPLAQPHVRLAVPRFCSYRRQWRRCRQRAGTDAPTREGP